MSSTGVTHKNISVTAPVDAAFGEILTPDALEFIAALSGRYESRRQELLDRRKAVQADILTSRFKSSAAE